jgi:hypothetical protein
VLAVDVMVMHMDKFGYGDLFDKSRQLLECGLPLVRSVKLGWNPAIGKGSVGFASV